MARAAVPVTSISRAGVAPPSETNGDAVNNHTVSNDARVAILARNSGAGARTITFRLNGNVDGQSVTPRTVSLAAGVSRWFGPFPTSTYGTSLLVDVEHAEVKLSAIHF
jgi:hypothetical protein